MSGICPFATWLPVANHGGAMGAHLGLVLHVQEGNNSLAGWFNNARSGASSTWWVSKTGALEQYVDGGLTAWAQGAGNGEYNSVETEGFTTEALTPAAEATLARLYHWGRATYHWPARLAEAPGQAGFGWHGMGGRSWGGHLGCPGDLRKNRRPAILAAAAPAKPVLATAPSGGSEDSAVTILTAPGRLDLFAIGVDGRIWQCTGPDYPALLAAPWSALGTEADVGCSVSASWSPDYRCLYLAVHGTDDRAYVAEWNGAAWSPFTAQVNGVLAPP